MIQYPVTRANGLSEEGNNPGNQPGSPFNNTNLPSSDFSSHFLIKVSSSATDTCLKSEKEAPAPSKEVSQCPEDSMVDHQPPTPSVPEPAPPPEKNDTPPKLETATQPCTSTQQPPHPFMTTSQQRRSFRPGSGPGLMFDRPPTPTLIQFPDSPMDFAYQPVTPFCLPKTRLGEYAKDNDVGLNDGQDSDYHQILKACGQKAPIPIDVVFNGVKDVEKIGEGVYGEVYSASFRYFNQCSWVYKVVAIAGDKLVNGEKQKGFLEVLPEIVVSQELSKLKGVLHNCYTDGFACMKNARVVKGAYPANLLQSWEVFEKKYESDNDRPDFFEPEQLYMVLEFEFAGQDVESLNFRDARQTLSIVLQVAHILAVGESALEFEHRDLHWGNILVKNWQAHSVRYVINGAAYNVPSIGIKAAVIDFTLSRVTHSKTQEPIYLDLVDDEEQFLGTGDHQFDVYRMMRDHNRNVWQGFCPKSNIFWLHYLANKLYLKGHYGGSSSPSRRFAHHQRAIKKLKEFSRIILEYGSALEFVQSNASRLYGEFLGDVANL